MIEENNIEEIFNNLYNYIDLDEFNWEIDENISENLS